MLPRSKLKDIHYTINFLKSVFEYTIVRYVIFFNILNCMFLAYVFCKKQLGIGYFKTV